MKKVNNQLISNDEKTYGFSNHFMTAFTLSSSYKYSLEKLDDISDKYTEILRNPKRCYLLKEYKEYYEQLV